MLKHAFCDLNLHRVWLTVLDTNAAARRVYDKVGFRVEGTIREGVFKDGRYHDRDPDGTARRRVSSFVTGTAMTPFRRADLRDAPAAADARRAARPARAGVGVAAGSPTAASQHEQLERALGAFLRVPQLSLFNNGTIGAADRDPRARPRGSVVTTPVHVSGHAARARVERHRARVLRHRSGQADDRSRGGRGVDPSRYHRASWPSTSTACRATSTRCIDRRSRTASG